MRIFNIRWSANAVWRQANHRQKSVARITAQREGRLLVNSRKNADYSSREAHLDTATVAQNCILSLSLEIVAGRANSFPFNPFNDLTL
jgi:ribosomal protein S9